MKDDHQADFILIFSAWFFVFVGSIFVGGMWAAPIFPGDEGP